MKISLVVQNEGKNKGKEIPIGGSEFLIGKNPSCHLKPAAPGIADKHCSLAIKQGKAILKDFGSPEGTWLNGKKINAEVELKEQDSIKVGPLLFSVKLQVPITEPKPETKAQPKEEPAAVEDDMDALLFGDEDKSAGPANWRTGGGGESSGEKQAGGSATGPEGEKKPGEAPKPSVTSSTAAEDLLKKFMRPKK